MADRAPTLFDPDHPATLGELAPVLQIPTAWNRNDATETELGAAAAHAKKSLSIKSACLKLFNDAGETGLNDDELAQALDEYAPRRDGDRHNPSKIASRRKELAENRDTAGEHGAPLIEPVEGLRRVTRRHLAAQVWRVTPAGIVAYTLAEAAR